VARLREWAPLDGWRLAGWGYGGGAA